MAYHSEIQCERTFNSCNMAWCPLKNPNNIRGNAPAADEGERDIVDEILYYYRPNVFFASYDIESPVDRTYVYGSLYAQECLKVGVRDRKMNSPLG